MRSEERSVVGNYVSTAEVRLTMQTGPSHPHPGVGGVSTPRRPNATPGGGFRARACSLQPRRTSPIRRTDSRRFSGL
ncbi:MAG: hypothetical protein ACOX9B_10425 [Candidatus Xenobium sp.]|nr:hypothetical protein [Burkholderiales bacterium]